jgi:RHS repeat-associated protein
VVSSSAGRGQLCEIRMRKGGPPAAGATSFNEQDGLGSATSLSNGAGALANTYTFDSFGKLTASSGSIINPFRYTAREFDSETSLYFYRARYYDPVTGRFLSEDPISFVGGINFYVYVFNEPTNWRDPSGKDVLECRRPVKVPFAGDTPHTFLYSTQTGGSWGFTTKNDVSGGMATALGKCVAGSIESESPFDKNGKLKPGYSCFTVSKDVCYEKCVNDTGNAVRKNPPCYQMGRFQCDTWVAQTEGQCLTQCSKK